MLSHVPCKSKSSVSTGIAAGSEVLRVASIVLAYALLASGANAHAYSGGEPHEPWQKRVFAKPQKQVIVGRASWYGQVVAGHKTATGERLDPNKLTAATTRLPLQSSALVTNLNNGRSVPVRINDCGPYVKGRDIDVSKRAAEKLAMTRSGTVPVTIKLIAVPADASYCQRPRPALRSVHKHTPGQLRCRSHCH
jgi:rare lipoprotein A